MAFIIPDGTGYAGVVPIQISETSLGTDQTTASTANPPTVDLLTASITTVASTVLYIFVTFSGFNTTDNANIKFAIDVDGTDHVLGAQSQPGASAGMMVSMMKRVTGLSAAAHTVTVEWSASSGTATCNASTNTLHHCRILLIEMSG